MSETASEQRPGGVIDQFPLARRVCLALGRGLLGIYFIIPGLMKVFGWDQTVEYMAAHNVPLIPLLLAITIVLQIGCGAALLAGYRASLMALLLAVLTLLINLNMHDFWNVEEALVDRERQNFIKNLAIMAGLLFIAGTPAQRNGPRSHAVNDSGV